MIKVKQKGLKYDGIPNENDSLFLKIQETENFLTSTVAAETKETKQRIFELYANEMFLGSGSYGVAAAAKRYFNKSLDQLAPHECALIAGLFQSPSAFNPLRHPERARTRQTAANSA